MDGAVPSYILYNPQGSKPLAGIQVEVGAVSRCYDKSTKSQLLQMNSGARVSFLRAPASSARPGGSVSAAWQRVVVLQLCCEQPARGTFALTVEFTLQDRRGRRRLLFSTSCARTQQCAQHVKVPLRCAAPGQWANFVFDIPQLHAVLCSDGGVESRRLLQVSLSCSAVCYVRRVMGMPQLPTVAEEWPLALMLPPDVPASMWVVRTGDEAFLFQRSDPAAESLSAAVDSSANMSASRSLADVSISRHDSFGAATEPTRVASQNVSAHGQQAERPVNTSDTYTLPTPLPPNVVLPSAVLPNGVVPNIVIPNAVILNAVLPNMATESTSDYRHALEVMRERMRRIQIVVGNDGEDSENGDRVASAPSQHNRNRIHKPTVRSNPDGEQSSTTSSRPAPNGTGDSCGSSNTAGPCDPLDGRIPRDSGCVGPPSLASAGDPFGGRHGDAGEDIDEDEGFTVNVCMSACAPGPPAVVMPPDVSLTKPPVAPSHPIDCLCLDPVLRDGARTPVSSPVRASEWSFRPAAAHAEDDATRLSDPPSPAAARALLRRGRLNDVAAQTPPLPCETSPTRLAEEAASSVSDYRRPVPPPSGWRMDKFIHVPSARGDDEDAHSMFSVKATSATHSQAAESKGNEKYNPLIFDPVLQCCLDLRTNKYVMVLQSSEVSER